MAISDRGFASMDPKKQRKIARKGGKTISMDKKYMSKIGRKGGLASGKIRKIGKEAEGEKLEKGRRKMKKATK